MQEINNRAASAISAQPPDGSQPASD